jgi:hypothetical protein
MRIPVKAAKDFANEHALRQVVIFAFDGKACHCVTYGSSVEDCDQAATAGNRLKTALGWPDSLMSEPSRVKALKSEIKKLKDQITKLGGVHNG